MIRESHVAVEALTALHSSLGLQWAGVSVFEHCINAGAEITLPAQDYHAIAMVLSGMTDVVQRRDAKRYRSMARPGTVMIVPAGASSYFSSSRAHRTSRTEITAELLACAAGELGAREAPELRSVFETRDPIIAHLVGLFLDELRQLAHPAQSLIVGAASNALAAHLVRSCDARTVALPKAHAALTSRQLDAVLDYLESNIAMPVALAEVAAIAKVSRFHFTRLFKASTGVSPMAYLEASRIDRAQALIRAGNMRLSEIALAIGFADQSHFTRRFRLHTGVTPGRYERSYLGRRKRAERA